jgi:hypothetical protein
MVDTSQLTFAPPTEMHDRNHKNTKRSSDNRRDEFAKWAFHTCDYALCRMGACRPYLLIELCIAQLRYCGFKQFRRRTVKLAVFAVFGGRIPPEHERSDIVLITSKSLDWRSVRNKATLENPRWLVRKGLDSDPRIPRIAIIGGLGINGRDKTFRGVRNHQSVYEFNALITKLSGHAQPQRAAERDRQIPIVHRPR